LLDGLSIGVSSTRYKRVELIFQNYFFGLIFRRRTSFRQSSRVNLLIVSPSRRAAKRAAFSVAGILTCTCSLTPVSSDFGMVSGFLSLWVHRRFFWTEATLARRTQLSCCNICHLVDRQMRRCRTRGRRITLIAFWPTLQTFVLSPFTVLKSLLIKRF